MRVCRIMSANSIWDIFIKMLMVLCAVNSNYSVLFCSHNLSDEEGRITQSLYRATQNNSIVLLFKVD